MAGTVHEDSSTDVSDSSTDVSGDEDVAGTTRAVQSPAQMLKRSAEPLPSTTPAKRAKNPEDDGTSGSTSTKEPVNALDFLKSRPQIAAMNNMREVARPSANSRPLMPDSWEQQHETILEFLRRVPVGGPATAQIGPWLWVRCAKELQDWDQSHDLAAFLETAEPLLDGLLEQRRTVEEQNPGKAVSTITRKMGPYRDQLEIDLLNTATNHGLTSGKWMLFTMSNDLPRVWRLVAEATAAGKLGPCSKVGTWEPDHVTKATLICVYTKNFSDLTDVTRVLSNLNEVGIVAKIFYKCDAYTYLEIESNNSYKLRASLYSSDEVRDDKVRYQNGVITRLKTKNGAMEGFLDS